MRGSKRRAETLTAEPEVEDAEESTDKRNGFFACYLICSLCPRYKGHTYIGFTVNPRRRIRQHNGEIKCGAWRTKSKRPWEMVLCIHGFPSKVSALQFEWAWQHPRESKAVREAALSFKSLSGLANKIKLAYTMLTLPQWERFNLSLNFFSSKYTVHSAHCPRLPKHMKTTVLPMDELPCYSDNPISDDENDDHILKEREVHHIHEQPASPSNPKNAESGEVEPTWMKIHDDGYELEQDLVHDFQRRDHHINEPISLIHHKIVESGEEEPMWMKFQDDHYELNDDHGHDPQGGEVREHETISLTHPENVESSEEPTWIKIHDDVYELEEDHDHDFLEREDHTGEPISLCQLKNVESDDKEPVWMKICDDGYELDEDRTRYHDLLEGEEHIHEPVSLSHPENVESDEEKPTLMKIHDGGCELYRNHDILEPISLNNRENIESDEEKKHDHDHVSIYSTRLNSMEFGEEKQHDHDVEEREDNVHGSIFLSGPKILESNEEDRALNKMSNLDQRSLTACQRGAFLLDVIDLSTPPSCRVSCKRGKPMTSICVEIIDLTGSPV